MSDFGADAQTAAERRVLAANWVAEHPGEDTNASRLPPREYPMPPYGVLPFADPIARVVKYEGQDMALRTIPWRTHFRIMRHVRQRRLKGA